MATGPGSAGLILANGARTDILIDFAHPVFKGRNIVLRNDCPAPFSGSFGPGSEDWLIQLMEGVEDIPGTALA